MSTILNGDDNISSEELAKFQEQFLSESGYQKLSNGLIIQWVKTSSSVTDGTIVSLPIVFPNEIFIATHTANEAGTYCYSVDSLTTSNVRVLKRSPTGPGVNQPSSIIAIGY